MRAEEDADETAKPTRLGRPTLPTPLTHKIEEEGFTQLTFESTWRHITAYRFDESAERGSSWLQKTVIATPNRLNFCWSIPARMETVTMCVLNVVLST